MEHLQIESGDRLLDKVNWRILRALQEDARISFAELGRRVGLSSPAVAERVHKLEEAGIITGYHAAIDVEAVGLPIRAFLHISNPGDWSSHVVRLALDSPEVLECHGITGRDSYVLKVATASVAHLEALINRFEPYGQTETSLVLSSPVERRTLAPPED